MLSAKIYAGPITNLTDARYFAAWDVHWLSFNLSPTEDSFLAPNQTQAIKEWVEGPAMVGEFNLHSAEEIQKLAVDLQLDGIKLGPDTSLETLMQLDTDLPVLKAITLTAEMTAAELEDICSDFAANVSHFILDFVPGAWSLEKLQKASDLNWGHLLTLNEQYPIIFNLGLNPADTLALIENETAISIQLTGGAEEKVGYKSFDELDEIFEALEE